jgi:hypothetical protein
MGAAKWKKSSASGTRQEEKHLSRDSEDCNVEEQDGVSCFGTELSSCLCCEVRNRVRLMFKMPLSVWELQLLPNIYCCGTALSSFRCSLLMDMKFIGTMKPHCVKKIELVL